MIKNILKALGYKKKRVPKNEINNIWIHKVNVDKKDLTYVIKYRYNDEVKRANTLYHVDFMNGDSILFNLKSKGTFKLK